MTKCSKLRVMISSRCNDPFPVKGGRSLSDIRKDLKQELESIRLFEKQLFEVWINEEAPPKGGTWDSWDTCIQAVKDCHVLIVLYNGNAGWAKEKGDIGICHSELMTGLSQAPGKVRLIELEVKGVSTDKTPAGERNRRFQKYVETQDLFRGNIVKTEEELKTRVKEAVHDALVSLAQAGVREASRGKFHSGEALDWTHLNLQERSEKMVKVLRRAILGREDAKKSDGQIFVRFAHYYVLLIPHAIPDALNISAAREMVGQPFLQDYQYVNSLRKNYVGPMHIIACHKTSTENQAIKMLGFPNAAVVRAPFGIFVADSIQKVQFALITNCRDETNTRHGVQRFFDWLEQTGEGNLIAQRAASRAKIIKVIAKEVKS